MTQRIDLDAIAKRASGEDGEVRLPPTPDEVRAGGLSTAGCIGVVALCIVNAYLWCTGILWTLERLGWL